jgi:hypothetical protein
MYVNEIIKVNSQIYQGAIESLVRPRFLKNGFVNPLIIC